MAWTLTDVGGFARVTWRNVMGDGAAVFEGEGTYRLRPDSSGVHRGTWIDSQGAIHPLAGAIAGDSLVTEWGTAATTLGRTTYRLTGNDAMRVTDEIHRGGRWVVFGTSTFTRSASPAD